MSVMVKLWFIGMLTVKEVSKSIWAGIMFGNFHIFLPFFCHFISPWIGKNREKYGVGLGQTPPPHNFSHIIPFFSDHVPNFNIHILLTFNIQYTFLSCRDAGLHCSGVAGESSSNYLLFQQSNIINNYFLIQQSEIINSLPTRKTINSLLAIIFLSF